MAFFTSQLCTRCKGRGYCGKPCKILEKISDFLPKSKTHFSGSTPPEIFVGRVGYPYVNTGILSPEEYGDTSEFSLPEIWYEKNFTINQIMQLRGKLIYGRFKTLIKDVRKEKKLLDLTKEISLTSKPVSVEVFLKKPPQRNFSMDKHIPFIGNPAPLKSARLEENPRTEKKAEYLSSDTDIKAADAIKELYKSKIQTSQIIKILSAGLLGGKTRRKLVPTRWSVTAVDDTLSKNFLEKIRYYPEINEISLFHGYYVGNHYEILLLPDKFSFEVIEAYMSGSTWNPFSNKINFTVDYEGFSGRKYYAENVTGAYYTVRLSLCEYLEKIKKQASCLVLREERPEYNAPLGVGILRELSRDIFKNKPEIFLTIKSALEKSQTRMKLPVSLFKEKSWLLKEYKKQKRLAEFT